MGSLEALKDYMEVAKRVKHIVQTIDPNAKVYAFGSAVSGSHCLEELTRPWHVHIDNYCNYMTGYCGGLTHNDSPAASGHCQ